MKELIKEIYDDMNLLYVSGRSNHLIIARQMAKLEAIYNDLLKQEENKKDTTQEDGDNNGD